jgi:predicted phosphate transport protein (TIGR00153 family)
MKKNEIFTRTPILQTIRKSPFDGLLKHFECVKAGISIWDKTVNFYINGNYTKFDKYQENVDKYEQQADKIKGNIRNHLPKFIFMPIDKGDFLMLLKETDGILDAAKDVVILMDMKETKIPDNLKKEFHAVIKKALEPVETLEILVASREKRSKELSIKYINWNMRVMSLKRRSRRNCSIIKI